jgi:acyl-CoA thioester hydrolase
MQSKGQLKTSNNISIRFSEVDSMNIVWHGSYVLYFEDAGKFLESSTDWIT